MKSDFFSESIKSIKDADLASRDISGYKVISVRPGDEAAALIDVMTELNNNRLPLIRISNIISEELANFTTQRKEHAKILLKVLEQSKSYQPESAIGILLKQGFIERIPTNFNVKFINE